MSIQNKSRNLDRVEEHKPVSKGLAGVVVDTTAIADVQAQGVLSYRGRPIEELVAWPFQKVVSLLLGRDVDVSLTNLSESESGQIISLDRSLGPMRVLQAMTPILECSGHSDFDRGVVLASKLPTVLATHHTGGTVQVSEEEYATSFLSAFNQVPTQAIELEHAAAFRVLQILQLEHSFNAGTFAARVVASTLADLPMAIAAGFGALSGPLHGGADQAALEVVENLDSKLDVRKYLGKVLAEGLRLPGMGHREYRVRDPRAEYIEHWAQRLSMNTPHAATFDKLKYLEVEFGEHMRARGKPVYANVEFYKGLVYRILGLPNDYFTAAFALARVYGYIAHFLESRENNRIYRPQALYIGS